MTGKQIEVREVERKSHDLVVIFRNAQKEIHAVTSAQSTSTDNSPKSILQLSGIVAEDNYLLKNAINQGDGAGPELQGARKLEDVENARKAYFLRLKSLYEGEQVFWNRLTDASAEAADLVVRIEQLGQSFGKIDPSAIAELKLNSQSIIDGVTRYRQFANRNEINLEDVWLAYLQRDYARDGLKVKGITDRTDLPLGLTAAIFLRQTIGGIEATNIPSTIAVLEALQKK